jgi:hypothetical protein
MIFNYYPAHLGAVRIVENVHLVETVEDWSAVRSPSRARRRQAQGHRQNIRTVTRPMRAAIKGADGTLYVHPAVAAEISRSIAARIDQAIERANMVGRR